MIEKVTAAPGHYEWPQGDAELLPENTALLLIDFQVDFCKPGGYVDQMGYDISKLQAAIEPSRKVLACCRELGFTVIHTREGHRADLSDLPSNKRWRSKRIGAGIGDKGPMGKVLIRGEPGWELIPELTPITGEPVIDKPGKGSFVATDLELILTTKGIKNIVLAGLTTDVCVSTTMREANDRGYECLLLTDCTAATDPANYAATLSMISKQGGVFGSAATSTAFMQAVGPSDPAVVLNGAAGGVTVTVAARPYDFELPVSQTCAIFIDFQKDFFLPGGFGDTLGNDIGLLQACLPGAQNLLAAVRTANLPVVHTLEAHKPDLSDLHKSKFTRGNLPPELRIGAESVMGRILVRNEPGNGIVDEVAPIEGEKCLFKQGKGAFYATDLDVWLKARGITHLLFAGVTTEVCVQTTMREANDRGYECCLITDATESYFPEFKASFIDMCTAQGAIVGWAATSSDIEQALASA